MKAVDVDVPTGARVVDDPAELRRFFADEPAAHIYALGDLEEPYWPASRWLRRGDAVVGLVGLPGDDLAVYAVATRDEAGTLALLAEVVPALPPGQLITGPTGLADCIERAGRAVDWTSPHLRHRLADFQPRREVAVGPLGPDDVEELAALYAVEPGSAFFVPFALAEESFVGVRADGQLVAAAGTHVLSLEDRAAAIGAVFTHPEHRGRGLAHAVTTGVVDRLADRVSTIGLNVAVDNVAARRVYEALGFEPFHLYDEARIADVG